MVHRLDSDLGLYQQLLAAEADGGGSGDYECFHSLKIVAKCRVA